MRCTSVKKNKGCKCIYQKLTDNCVGLLVNILHIYVIHLTSGERVGLLSKAFIAIPVLGLRAISGIVSGFPALETRNVTQIFLCGCCGAGTILSQP